MRKRIYFTCLFAIIFTLLPCVSVAAQMQRPWWYTLEQGKRSFRDGSYGEALLSFEDARRQRKAMYERMERNLIELLSIYEVRRFSDALDLVEKFALERRYDDAMSAIAEVYYRYPKDQFGNSATAVLEMLGKLKDYPEAEYWIGEVYRSEGELGLAIAQFQKAYDLRDLLETPGFDVELLYKIADIRKTRQEYNAQQGITEMEKPLILILENDTLWASKDGEKGPTEASFARRAMAQTLEKSGVDQFLQMYRYTNIQVEAAHRKLGLFYYATGRHSKAAEHLMFAFLIQNSIIIEELIRADYEFEFTGMKSLADKTGKNPLIAEFMEKVDYYRTAYYLAASLFATGKAASARGMWTSLANYAPTGEWRNRSLSQIRNPRVELAIEMP